MSIVNDAKELALIMHEAQRSQKRDSVNRRDMDQLIDEEVEAREMEALFREVHKTIGRRKSCVIYYAHETHFRYLFDEFWKRCDSPKQFMSDYWNKGISKRFTTLKIEFCLHPQLAGTAVTAIRKVGFREFIPSYTEMKVRQVKEALR